MPANWESPYALKGEIRRFIDYYNSKRYHEALDNVAPDDAYYARKETILKKRANLKHSPIARRRAANLTITTKPETETVPY